MPAFPAPSTSAAPGGLEAGPEDTIPAVKLRTLEEELSNLDDKLVRRSICSSRSVAGSRTSNRLASRDALAVARSWGCGVEPSALMATNLLTLLMRR